MESKSSPYSIEDEEAAAEAMEGDAFLDIDEPFLFEHSKAKREVDTMLNRAVLLSIVGLLVVFTICVARGGAVDGMEWIRDRILPVPGLEEARKAVMSASNMVFRESGAQGSMAPLVLVVATTAEAGLDKNILDILAQDFTSIGFNKTAVVWVWDSDAHLPLQWVHPSDSQWSILQLSRKNATTMEALVDMMISDMHVGVLYIDSAFGMGATLSQTIFMDQGEDVALYEMINTGWKRAGTSNESIPPCWDPASILKPPVVPLIDTSLLLAWSTPGSRGLFRDAEDWARAHATVHSQGSTSFAINVLLNSRRDGEVQEVGAAKGDATLRCMVWKYAPDRGEAFVLLRDRPCTLRLTGVKVENDVVRRALGRATPATPMEAVLREVGEWDAHTFSFRGGVLGLMEVI